MKRMRLRIRLIENWYRALPGVLALAALLVWSPAARADVPPSCDSESSLITCAAADVGKPCQGSGACYQVRCANNEMFPLDSVYKCDACPTVLPDQSFGCQGSKFGMDCGGGGTCIYAPAYCSGNTSNFISTQYICGIAAAAKPTGPPSGTGAGGAGGATTATGGAGGTTTAAGGAGGTTTAAGGAGGTSSANGGAGGTSSANGGAGGTSSANGGSGGASSANGGAGGTSAGVGGASSAPTTVGSTRGGCDVNNGAPAASVVALALLAIGLLFLALSGRRRSR